MQATIAPPARSSRQDLEKTPPRVQRNLDAWALAALEGRHHYASHYAAACAVASHALARGWNRGLLWEKFEELAREEARQQKRAPSASRLRGFIHRAWDYAEKTRKATGDPFAVARGVNTARAALEGWKFTGRQHSLLLVMEAALEAAIAQKTLAPSLAVRSVELATGLGKSTVQRALVRLVELDFLQPASKSDGDNASVYRIRNSSPDMAQSGTQEVTPGGAKRVSHLRTASELAKHDAFRGLGRAAARVVTALDELEAVTPHAIAKATGLSPKTVRAALRALEATGLAQRHKEGRGFAWTLRTDMLSEEHLRRIAADYGTSGHGERVLARTVEQRRRWHEWREQRAKAKAKWQESRGSYLNPQLVRAVA